MVEKTMKRLSVVLSVLGVLCMPLLVFAQAASLPATGDLSTDQALGELLKSLGGLKGATALGIVAVVVQAVLLFFRTPLANFAGKWKLLIVTGLTLVAGVIALVASGVPWLAAFTHSATLASVQVFANQIWKQVSEKNVEPGAEH